MAVLPREFCNFTPDFCGLAPMCIVGRVRRSQQKTVHAEPCEAMPLQQGGHWVGENRSRDILKRRLQASCLWHPRISQIRTILSEQGNGRCPRDVFIRIPLPIFTLSQVWHLSCLGITIFISAWAISVARSTISGNARAFGCGTGSRTVPTSFFYAVSHVVECVQLGNTG